MNLKQLLEDCEIKQATVAKAIDVSPATMCLIVNKGKFPKNPKRDVLERRITNFLVSKGVDEKVIGIALADLHIQDYMERLPLSAVGCAVRTDTQTTSSPSTKTQPEDELVLLKKQSLSQAARKQFGIFQNPFTADVTSNTALYKSSDVNYVSQAMFQTAKNGGFIAVTGESGSGKTTLRRELIDRINREQLPITVIEPYSLATEENDIKGKTMKSSHIAEAIIGALSPRETAKRSTEARFRQVHRLLKESAQAGQSHVIIIEEAHSLPIPTLKHLKRFYELEDGYKKLLSIILVGQNELAQKLSEQDVRVREVVQRCEVVTLNPIPEHELQSYLLKKCETQNIELSNIIDDSGLQAIADRLTMRDGNGKVQRSLLYPLAIGNLLTGAINKAAELCVPMVSKDIVMGA